MTNNKTYPIGTKIVFIAHKGMCSAALQDDGKKGEVIGETSYGEAIILLYSSAKNYGKKGEWNTSWSNIKPVIKKNQQLLFSFMVD